MSPQQISERVNDGYICGNGPLCALMPVVLTSPKRTTFVRTRSSAVQEGGDKCASEIGWQVGLVASDSNSR